MTQPPLGQAAGRARSLVFAGSNGLIERRPFIQNGHGHGNAPSDAEFIDAVRRYTARGGLLLNISQAAQGCVAAVYAQGSALRAAGAVSGGKCNLETATALLTLALSEGWTAERLAAELQRLRLV